MFTIQLRIIGLTREARPVAIPHYPLVLLSVCWLATKRRFLQRIKLKVAENFIGATDDL